METDDGGPQSGVADFCGVRYRFSRNDHHPLRKYRRWVFYDLVPVDPSQGLPMVADGTFREASGGAGGLEVYWNSMGSPGLSTDPAIRERFAAFLERLATGTATLAHVNAFVVEHYPDALVEEVRRTCSAFLSEAEGGAVETAREHPRREQLLALAARLRGDRDRPTGRD